MPQAGKAGLEEQWLTVDTRTQARIAALQRCFPSASPDAVSSALAACGNDLQAAKQVRHALVVFPAAQAR